MAKKEQKLPKFKMNREKMNKKYLIKKKNICVKKTKIVKKKKKDKNWQHLKKKEKMAKVKKTKNVRTRRKMSPKNKIKNCKTGGLLWSCRSKVNMCCRGQRSCLLSGSHGVVEVKGHSLLSGSRGGVLERPQEVPGVLRPGVQTDRVPR